MPYLGQRPSKGDENNFKILDDISSYTLTFDGSDASVVSAANDTITSLNHRFVQGQRVTYNNCLLYTSPSPRDVEESRMPSSA